jgi:hypothetical protein
LGLRHPGLVINFFDVASDTAARERLFEPSAAQGISRPGVPAFEKCGDFSVGFSLGAGKPELLEARITGGRPALYTQILGQHGLVVIIPGALLLFAPHWLF